MSPLTMLKFVYKNCSLLILILFSLAFINSCGSDVANIKNKAKDYKILASTVTTNFADNGRLWRLIPTSDTMFVDYSNDNGKNYSEPVKINPTPQKINAWPENPPQIAIAKSGRIHVLYYADEEQKATNFYSYSDDNGKSFSQPVLVSDKADSAMHYMAKMLLDDEDNLYLFWHDTRHNEHNHHLGSGVLALYYTSTNHPEKGIFENHLISHGICSCCRTATTLNISGQPVVFARMVFADGIRDHALFKMEKSGQWSAPQKITDDNWQIEACPEHGPALAIDHQNRHHLAWFTLGDKRQGIFYAYTDDEGKTLSDIMPLGNKNQLPGHPDIIAVTEHVAIAWSQFDGDNNHIFVKTSSDRGKTWSKDRLLLSLNGKTSHPKLLNNGRQIFLSLTSTAEGHQLIEIPYEN